MYLNYNKLTYSHSYVRECCYSEMASVSLRMCHFIHIQAQMQYWVSLYTESHQSHSYLVFRIMTQCSLVDQYQWRCLYPPTTLRCIVPKTQYECSPPWIPKIFIHTDPGPSLAILSSSSLSQLLDAPPLPGIATLAYSSVSIDLQKWIAYFSFSLSTAWKM